MRRDKKPVTPSQWRQVGGGGAIYEEGTTPYQQKGLVAPVGPSGSGHQLPGKRGGLQGRQTLSPVLLSSREQGTDKKEEKAAPKEPRRRIGFRRCGLGIAKGLGKASYQAARMGAVDLKKTTIYRIS